MPATTKERAEPMARNISGKIVAKATMTAQTPISIGSIGAGDAVDLEVAVNGRGEPYIPGSSLMGPLRAMVESDSSMKELANKMFGFQREDNGHASFLVIEDAKVRLPKGLGREIRDGIGIDSRTGATEEGKKYTRAVLPRGSSFTLELELDLPPKKEKDDRAREFAGLLRWMLDQVKDKGLLLGASKTRGLGHVTAGDIEAVWYGFPDDMPLWLDNSKGWALYTDVLTEDLITQPRVSKYDRLDIVIEWHPLSPVMVKSGADGGIADMLPLVSGYEDDSVAPVIPGSSVKGVFRARAEKILRTVLGSDLLEDDPDFLSNDLFGSTEAAGRLRVDDTYQSGNTVPAALWTAEDKTTMDGATDHHDHVAIDRFTGGASDTALFNTRTPKREKAWDTIKLSVDFTRPKVLKRKSKKDEVQTEALTDEEKCRAAALVLLVLRDMAAGWVPIGFGSCRGMGDIAVDGITIKGQVGKVSLAKDTLDSALKKTEFQEAWTTLVKEKK